MAQEQSQRTDWPLVVRQAFVAGLTGAITIDLFLWLASVLPQHGSMVALWQWVASAAIGPSAMTSTSYAWLGVLVHLLVSIGWAGGYAFLARTRPFMNERWYISGPMYGAMVYVFMDLALLGAGKLYDVSAPLAIITQVIAHCVFYGLPVAYVIARLDRSA